MQGLISPLKAKAELRVRTPKDKEEQTGFVLDVKSSGLEIQPSFGQMPLFHSAIRIAIEQAQLGHLVIFLYTEVSEHCLALKHFHSLAMCLPTMS